jgi:O-methyltransferase
MSQPARPPYSLRRAWRERGDVAACAAFVADGSTSLSLADRLRIVRRLYAVSFTVDCPHRQREMLDFTRAVLALPRTLPGVIVEAGCYKGGGTAKLSLAAHAAGRELVVFDSFRGLPPHDEPHDRNIYGRPERFEPGAYSGSLEEVKLNVARLGRIEACRFVPGWFEETMPAFNEPIAAIYLDVDLAASTRTCLRHLYPLLQPGGVLFSQDGHLPLVIAVFDDVDFWLREVGCPRPRIPGLGREQIIRIVKES